MIIDVKQTIAEKENEFEILYNNKKVYTAKTPFIEINGIGRFDKLRQIQVFDEYGKEKYITKYNFIENMTEELIPLKYIATNSQNFNQYSIFDVTNNNEVFSIYYKRKELFNGNYIISINNKIYNCYSIEDGYIIHLPIYDGDVQIGELLKVQVITDAKDTYRVYLKDECSYLSDAIMMLALYLDRLRFNSSYMKVKGYEIRYSKTYSKVNKYYDPNWVIENFDANDFFEQVEVYKKQTKEKIKKEAKRILQIIVISWIIVLIIFLIFANKVFL